MKYNIDLVTLGKLKLKASYEHKSVEIIIKEALENAVKDIVIESSTLSKPKPIKKEL